MDRVKNLQQIGDLLLNAASIGVDVLTDGIEPDAVTTVVAGNDNTGKTTLLYTARYGTTFNRKLLVPTVGYNMEVLKLGPGASLHDEMVVVDVGGGSRMGHFFFKHMTDANALLYVVRGSDMRFVSALWELYLLVRLNPDVHVSVMLCTDTSTDPDTARLMTRLLQPDALPPTRDTWARILDVYDNHNQGNYDLWSADREWTERKRRTASHGMVLPATADDALPLLLTHHGSWIVTRSPPAHALLKDQALDPFVQLLRRIVPPKQKANYVC